ncbi:pathogen-associated molecular patterns-induced protein A70-like isoform X2 [Gastrolobium bilobum]|uniref:pathogen-associated molecular patterns-induced protein A70-like isoform X2 n=1 Tax=Gastrolobium bilobum TaxID=150636 RepID=UPI002AAF95E9|nr:pathogen-associated molecular patterns-induced protein A70-like isoform X2 [Gastrolobium bilobum]
MADPTAIIASWFTPSSLFIIVNLVIGTIAITSRFGAPKREIHDHEPQLVRSPSLLERVRSFNFSFNKYEPTHAETEYAPTHQPESENPCPNPDNPQLVRTPSLLQRLRSMSFSRREQEPESEGPDPKPGRDSGNAEMRKSASERAGSMKCEREEDEEAVERRRPATARGETTSLREDEEVDAKADDFINRFKKQLRLQRVDSLLRYRDMLRGN